MSSLRDHRQRAGRSQQALADEAGLSRQAYGAIEAGRATPGVDVALALARALGTSVEALFAAAAERTTQAVALDDVAPGGRVTLARVHETLVAVPVSPAQPTRAADGHSPHGGPRGSLVQVACFHDASTVAPAWRDRVVVAGCALGLGVVVDRLNAVAGAGQFLWWPTHNAEARRLLSQGLVHMASSHLADQTDAHDDDGVDAHDNASSHERAVTLGRWQLGCATRPGDLRVRHRDDLRRKTLRLVHREPGAGAERLLRRLVGDAERRGPLVRGHLDVARAVSFGAADVGICAHEAAISLGLRFVPLQEERVVVHLSSPAMLDDRVARFLDALGTRVVRRDLDALGYDTRDSGAGLTS